MYGNNKRRKIKGLFLGILLCILSVACGGGGGGDDVERTPSDQPGPPASQPGPQTPPADTSPDFGTETIDAQSYIDGVAITPLTLPPATGGNEGLTYSIDPEMPFGLTFDPATRELSGTPTPDGMETIMYKVVDADDNTQAADEDTLTFTITVAANTAPAFDSRTIRAQSYVDGVVITPLTLPGATGGNGDLTYSIEPESPFGLTFNPANRRLSGTPTSAGMETITYKVVDEDGDTREADEETLTFTIRVIARIAGMGICDRTPRVRDAIVGAIRGINNCQAVTPQHLAGITGTIDLSGSGINSLQADDFEGLSGLTVLDLTRNRLTTLPEDLFDGLTSLTMLRLNDASLTTVPEDVFNGLSSLDDLSLQGNALASLPEDLFDGLTSLTELDLARNRLTTLPEDVFDGLTSLTELQLGVNRISSLPEDVFDGLTSLSRLVLSNNALGALPEDVFDGLSSLNTLGLANNGMLSLHADLFDGLSALMWLDLRNTPAATSQPAICQRINCSP